MGVGGGGGWRAARERAILTSQRKFVPRSSTAATGPSFGDSTPTHPAIHLAPQPELRPVLPLASFPSLPHLLPHPEFKRLLPLLPPRPRTCAPAGQEMLGCAAVAWRGAKRPGPSRSPGRKGAVCTRVTVPAARSGPAPERVRGGARVCQPRACAGRGRAREGVCAAEAEHPGGRRRRRRRR